MQWMSVLWRRLLMLIRREQFESDLEEEMRLHRELRAQEHAEAGMTPEEAHYAALRGFGNIALLKERSRETWGWSGMESAVQDARYGLRQLWRSPGFTAVTALILALGIGASTATFSVVNAVLLNPLPYRDPDRLVQFWETNPIKGWTKATVAPANLLDWEKQNQVFESMAAYFGSDSRAAGLSNYYLTTSGEPERLQGLAVTGGLFAVLGVDAALGRTLLEEETWSGKDKVVVLSHDLWERRFGGDPAIVGQSIQLSGESRTVVGVMPRGFYFPAKDVDLWVPFGWQPARIATLRRPHFLRAIARLKPGVQLAEARAEMSTIAARLERQYPDTNTQMGVGLGPLKEWIVEDSRRPLLVFLAAVGFVLLIACANVANLLLARASARVREFGLRAALGAPRARLVRQLLTESLLLSLTGGGLGLLLAHWGKALLLSFSPGNIPRMDEISLDLRVLAFALGASLLTSILFGLAPALASTKTDVAAALKVTVSPRPQASMSRLLVVSEIALAMILVSGAGLMTNSFVRLEAVSPGFAPEKILTMQLSLPGAAYPKGSQAVAFYEQLLERIRRLPGVEAAGATSRLPLRGQLWTSDFSIENRPPGEFGVEVRHKEIAAEYFRAIGIPLLRGRMFAPTDDDKAPPVVIINETLARRYFGSQDPVGQRLKFSKPEGPGPWRTIIGVVGDEKQDSLAAGVRPEIFAHHRQLQQSDLTLVVRATAEPGQLTAAIRSELQSLDANLPAFNIQTMTTVLHDSLARERFSMLLLGLFATLAAILAGVGIYGVMSYTVARRTPEIGVRMAVGAQRRDIFRLILWHGALLAAAGVPIGLGGALVLTRSLASLLYGVSPADPLTYAGVSFLVIVVVLLASYLPARQATNVDPLTALRYE